MHAIQFQSVAQLKGDLEALGFPVLPEAAGSQTSDSSAASVADQPDRARKFSPLL
jgi:hypothetical protein